MRPKYSHLDSTRAEYNQKAKVVCGQERFEEYNNCTLPFTLKAPNYLEKINDPEGSKIREECNTLCQKAGDPIYDENYMYYFIGGVWSGLVFLGVIIPNICDMLGE